MAIRFRCACGHALKASEESAGRKARCPQCGAAIRIPGRADDPGPPHEGAGAPAAPPLPSARVLLGESRAEQRETLTRMLEEHGYEVIAATDGKQAIDLARREHPDLIIVDVKMDEAGGFHVCQEVTDNMNQENKDVWQTPCVVVAANPNSREKQYAMSIGVKDYVPMDTPLAEFVDRIRKAMASR